MSCNFHHHSIMSSCIATTLPMLIPATCHASRTPSLLCCGEYVRTSLQNNRTRLRFCFMPHPPKQTPHTLAQSASYEKHHLPSSITIHQSPILLKDIPHVSKY